MQLHTGHAPQTGAEVVLDDQAKAAYRERLADLESGIDEAERDNDTTVSGRRVPDGTSCLRCRSTSTMP